MIPLINGISERWLAYMGSAAFQATLLALLVLVALRFGRRWPPALRHAVLMLAVCKFLVPPMLSLPTGVFSRIRPQEWFQTAPAKRYISPVLHNENGPVEGIQSYFRHSSPVKDPSNKHTDIETARTLPVPKPSLTTKGKLLLLHFAGALTIFAATALQQRRLRMMALRATQPTDPGLLKSYDDLCRSMKLRRQPRLLISADNHAPVTFGLWEPVVILPHAIVAALPSKEIRVILGHELAHHRRRDPWLWRLHVIVSALWWFNPVYWLLSRTVRSVREDCCDDMVVAAGIASRESYCRILLQAARVTCTGPVTGGALAYFVERHPLHRRLSRIMTARSVAFPKLASWGMLAVFALALLLLPGIKPGALAQNSVRIETSPRNINFAPPEAAIGTQTAAGAFEAEGRALEGNLYSRTPASAPPTYLAQEKDIPGFYRKWLEEDVAYIISNSERDAFNQRATDEDRDAFIEQFWARRNPEPHSVGNSFKEEHYRRISYANERFTAGIPGWKTDRGRFYIVFGKPDEIESYPAAADKRHSDENRGATATYPFEKWRYRQIPGIGDDIEIEFVDKSGRGDYRMAMSPDEKYALLNVPNQVTSDHSQLSTPDGSNSSDEILYQTGLKFLEMNQHNEARQVFEKLIASFPRSRFAAPSRLAIADSFCKEGGTENLEQAAYNYARFLITYPANSRVEEAELKMIALQAKMANISGIQGGYVKLQVSLRTLVNDYAGSDAYSRSRAKEAINEYHPYEAEEVIDRFLQKYPDSDLVPIAKQALSDVRENIADGNLSVVRFYVDRGNYAGALSRLKTIIAKYPDYSRIDEARQLYESLSTKYPPQEMPRK